MDVRPDFRDLIFVSLLDAYKMYSDAKMHEDVRGLREKWRMRKRAQERERDGQTEEKKTRCPSTSLHYVIGVGSAKRETLALKRRIVRCQFEVKDRRKRSRGDHLHFRLKTN